MASPLELPCDVRKENGRWMRDCPKCGNTVSHLRRNYCVHSSILNQPCKSCSNKNNNPSGMIGYVRLSWFNSFKASAETRGYSWNITPEFLDSLYIIQEGQCCYSGLPIGWSESGWNHTASIDRIDNNIGYEENNIQLVHKDVNMMRGSLCDDRFKELCFLITDKVKW